MKKFLMLAALLFIRQIAAQDVQEVWQAPLASCINVPVNGAMWSNIQYAAQGGTFTVTWDATPGSLGQSLNMGLAPGPIFNPPQPQAWNLQPVTVRFNTSNRIDAINGASFGASVATTYTVGTVYHFALTINIATATYSATVQPGTGRVVPLASNYAFRTAAGTITSLGYFNVMNSAGSGTSTVCNFAMSTSQPAHSATLAWIASVVDATHPAPNYYLVLKGSAYIAQVPGTSVTYTDINVLSGQKPCYQVQAKGSGGNSGKTTQVCATIP